MEIDLIFKKDLYKNSKKKCFILGTAPSITDVNFNSIKDQFTIGVNLILHSGFTPNLICVSDKDMISDNYDDIISKKMKEGFYVIVEPKEQLVSKKLKKKNNVKLVSSFKEPSSLKRYPHLDSNLEKFAVTKNGVINDLAVPLAIYLGFKNIYLLGVGGLHGSETHFYDTPLVLNTDKYKKSVVRVPYAEPVKYDLLLEKLRNTEIKIYNCASPLVHKELEYMPLEEALKK